MYVDFICNLQRTLGDDYREAGDENGDTESDDDDSITQCMP